jgi:uncharacterized CHY-type Zn-finger protein
MAGKAAGIIVHGQLVDDNTRCVHYHSALDIIAIKFKCCGEYYPCYQCHEETAGHTALAWEKDEWGTNAIFCGACKSELTIEQYMQSGNQCLYCSASFNPNCSKHYHLYFEV